MIKGAELVGRALGACVERVIAWRKTTIVLVLGLAALSLNYAAGHLGINTDTANMISAELPWRRNFIEYRESFAIRDQNIVVVVDAPTPDVADDFAVRLAGALRAEPELFESVFLAGEGEFFERNGLLYLPIEELEALSDRLVAAQPLLGLVTERFSGAAVVELAGQAVERTDLPTGSAELETLLDELRDTLDASRSSVRAPIDWSALFVPPTDSSTRRMLLVRPALDFSRVQPARPAIERVRRIAETLQVQLGVDVRSRLTGTVAMEHEELVSVTQGASFAGLSALALVTIVLLWALRSPVLLLISLLTLISGLVFTAAFAAVTVGHLNLLSVAFAVLYVGLGVDFILHLCLRLKELLASGRELENALVETARGVGTSLVICAVTTAAGFYAFIPTEFEGVSELGLISGTGMFVSLAVSLVLLPALIAQFWRTGARRIAPAPVARRLPVLPGVTPKRVIVAAAMITVVCLAMLPRIQFDGNPIRLRDPDSESIRVLDELAADSEAPIFNLVALADDRTTAERWRRELRELEAVEDVVTVDSLVPDGQDDKTLLLEDLSFVLGPDFARVDEAPFDAAELESAVESLRSTLDARPDPTASERSLLDAAIAWLEAVDDLGDPESFAMLQALDADLRADLPEQLAALEKALQARPFGERELPSELSERWINDRGQTLIEIVPAENVNDDAAAARFVDSVRGVVPKATGLPVVYQEASSTVVRAFSFALFYALVMVIGLLLVFLHDARDTLLVIVPILFAAVVTAGLTVLLDLPFNFANIIALPLLVGVGVDSGIHMVHRMRTEPPTDAQPLHTSTSRAVLASGLTTIASFGNLAFSSHVGMSSMGQLLTIGMAVTLIATLGLLPALLRTWSPR